jgi:hypothetical protein
VEKKKKKAQRGEERFSSIKKWSKEDKNRRKCLPRHIDVKNELLIY